MTARLRAVVLGAGVALLAGLATGHVEPVVVALPLVAAAGRALAATNPPRVTVALEVDVDRVTEGEEVVFTLVVGSPEPNDDVEVGLALPRVFEIVEGSTRWNIAVVPEEPTRLVIRTRAIGWGAHLVGMLGTRVYGPGRLVVFEEIIDARRVVKVFPATERLHRAIVPHKTQMSSGEHLSVLAGDGIEFATVRRLVAGDSPRRVNWRVSSRTGELYVNAFHLERNSDVVFFIDAFSDVGPPTASALDVTVRAIATLVFHYLRARDRIALVSFGGALRWLQGGTGRAQLYRAIDFLLDVSVTTSLTWKDIDLVPARMLLPGSLVIAFSPLTDQRSIGALGAMHERGASLVVVDTLDEAHVTPGPSREDRLAHRVWKLRRASIRDDLARAGIPVTRWSEAASVAEALGRLPRRRVPARPS